MNSSIELESAVSPEVASWRAFWIALLIAAMPVSVWYASDLWRFEHYRFFPMALLCTAWLIRSRWDHSFRGPTNWASVGSILIGFFLVASSVVLASPWTGALAAMLFGAAFCLSNRDSVSSSNLFAASLPVWLALRLPLNYDEILILRLQGMTTRLSSVVLDFLSIPHTISDNVIALASRELFVAEACSGIQSVFTLAFLGVAVVALYLRPLWLVPLYLVASFVLAIMTNVFRVCSIAIADFTMSIDLASGWPHEVVGYLALGIGAIFLLSFDQLVAASFYPD